MVMPIQHASLSSRCICQLFAQLAKQPRPDMSCWVWKPSGRCSFTTSTSIPRHAVAGGRKGQGLEGGVMSVEVGVWGMCGGGEFGGMLVGYAPVALLTICIQAHVGRLGEQGGLVGVPQSGECTP